MTTKKLLFLFPLLFFACRSGEQTFENEYLKIKLPPGWIIIDENSKDKPRWLTAIRNPLDMKNLEEQNDDPSVENLIVVATDGNGGTIEDFTSYYHETYWRAEKRVGTKNISSLDTVNLGRHEAYYWKTQVAKENREPLIQESYMLYINKFYLSFIFTHRANASLADMQQITRSISFK